MSQRVSTAVLLPNVTTFPSESMRRYAEELTAALQKLPDSAWQYQSIVCDPKSAPYARLGESWASRYARFVDYPQKIRRVSGDLYHVLDHSHANLAIVPPASKTILTCHDIIPLLAARGILDMPTGRFTKYTFPLRLKAMARCRRVIADSESTKRDLIQYGGLDPQKIDVVYLGINPCFRSEPERGTTLSEERAQIRVRYGLPETAQVVLHLGTATRYKNTPALIHALKALREIAALGDNVYLLRLGAPFFDDEQQLIDDLRVGDRIIHGGRGLSDSLLAQHYRAADVFAFPSLYEGFGWPLVEAMASGTAVVSSDAASLPEVVGDAGLMVPPRDHGALAEALRALLSDDELRAHVAAQCLARAQRFTWENCARDTLAVYQRVHAENV